MKRLILSGANGRMGHVIAAYVKERADCTIVAGIDQNTCQYEEFPIFSAPTKCNIPADCIIDFSHPSLLEPMLQYAVHHTLPIVVATTGLSQKQLMQLRTTSDLIPIFFSFNMSIGVNLLAALAKQAVAALGGHFDVEIIEKHHNQKVDAPSGTALLLADAVNAEHGGGFEYVYDRHAVHQKRRPNEIGIHSVRGGTIVGEHEIIFAGKDEIITLSHTALSKEIFANGAVNAALFLAGKPAGLYNMEDMVRSQAAPQV